MPLVEGSAQRGENMGNPNRIYEDISLKDFSKTLKSREKTVFKLFMEVTEEPLLRMLTDLDFENAETAIAMRKDLSSASKNSYKSILNNLKERIHKHTLQNVDLKTDQIVSWENLERCVFRQKNSKDITVCRNKNVLIKTTDLTPETCQLCDKVTEEMTQLEQITGVKPRLREYKALKIIKQKLTLKNDEIQVISKDRDFYKHEVDRNRSQRHTQNKTLENKLATECEEKQELLSQIHKLQTREKLLDTEVEEKVGQQTGRIKERLRGRKERCPQNNKMVSVHDDCLECPKFFECPVYGKFIYAE